MKRKNNRIRLIALAIVAAGLIGWAVYAHYTQPKKTTLNQPAADTSSQTSTDPNVGKQTEEAPKKEDNATASTPATTAQSSNASSMSVVISRAGQIDQTIQIRALIQGTKTGTCSAVLTGPNGKTTQGTHAVELQQTGYTCGSLDIPVSQFSVGGQWQLSLTVTANNQTSKPATQAINVTK